MTVPRYVTSLAVIACLLALGVPLARADEGEGAGGAPLQPLLRNGLTMGLSGGVGDVHVFPKNQSEIVASGGSVGINLGKALNQKTLVFVLADLVNDSNNVNTQMLVGGGAQIYFNRRIFGRAGVGIARYQNAGNPAAAVPVPSIDRWAPGALAGLGVEWLQLHTMALNAQLEWVGAAYPNSTQGDISALNVSLMFGIQWFGM